MQAAERQLLKDASYKEGFVRSIDEAQDGYTIGVELDRCVQYFFVKHHVKLGSRIRVEYHLTGNPEVEIHLIDGNTAIDITTKTVI